MWFGNGFMVFLLKVLHALVFAGRSWGSVRVEDCLVCVVPDWWRAIMP